MQRGSRFAVSQATGMDRAIAYLRSNARSVILEITVNGVLPYVVYMLFRAKLGDVNALLASMAPPLLFSIVEFARKRRVDAISIFVIAGIVLSLLAFAGAGSAKLLQLRENLVTGLVAVIFLGSAAIGKPLLYVIARASARRQSAEKAAQFDRESAQPGVRRVMMTMTVVWGSVMLGSTALACALVFALTIATYLIVSPILNYATVGGLMLWSIVYVRRKQRQAADYARQTAGETK